MQLLEPIWPLGHHQVHHDVQVVLLGSPGSGKSKTGNALFGAGMQANAEVAAKAAAPAPRVADAPPPKASITATSKRHRWNCALGAGTEGKGGIMDLAATSAAAGYKGATV